MNVYWLEQTEADVPVEDDWLSASEAVWLSRLRVPKRRADWRLGRWTAKRALALHLDLPFHLQVFKKIEVRPAPSGAPEAFVANQSVGVTMSLSHRAGTAICAVAASGVEMGCDLEVIEPRSDAFVADYFSSEEQTAVAREFEGDRPRLLALLWSAKESALKALRAGLRFDTRSVIVSHSADSFDLNGWSLLKVHYTGERHDGVHPDEGRVFQGWYQQEDNMLRTVVSAPPLDSPILLKISDRFFDSDYRCA
jgi:4'-phosphopantetheinyl transferase